MTTTVPVQVPSEPTRRAPDGPSPFEWGRRLAALAGLGGTLAVFLESLGWPFSLTAHWSLHLLLAQGALAALCLRTGARLLGALLLVAALFLGGRLVWSAGHGAAAPNGEATHQMKLGLVNVHTKNRNHAAVVDWVRESRPDLLAMIEVSQEWLEGLEPLRAAYPHRLAHPKDNNFGIALFSRWPVLSGGVFPFGEWELHQIEAVIEAPGGPLRVIVTHPPPPTRPITAAMSRRVVAEIARRAAASKEPVIVAGDLNATVWSADFRHLVVAGGLQRRHIGRFTPTWPDRLGLLSIGVAIDHVLVGGGLRVESQYRGPDVDSDHRPISVGIARVP